MVKVIHWQWSKVTQIQYFANFVSLETAKPIDAKFHMEPPWDGRTKICSNGPDHKTNMAAMPIYGKTLKKNLLLWNQKADDIESWYIASLVPYAFVWEKVQTMDLSETIVVHDVKVGRCSEYQRSKSFIDLGSRLLRFNIFKLLFPRNC